jgi:hypothetical protein
MTALPSALPATPSSAARETIHQEIERIHGLHRLAVHCLNAVLSLHTLQYCGDCDRYGREALLQLQNALNELPQLPVADDPFAADEVVEAAGVVATSLHTAAFDIAQRTWHTVQIRALALGIASNHQDESGQSYTRITSELMTQAPTETLWSLDVWRQVCQYLTKDPALDLKRIQAQLTLERLRALRGVEARFGILVTEDGAAPSSIGVLSLGSSMPISPTVPTDGEQTTSGTLAPPQPPQDGEVTFIPSELQERILAVLNQKALTQDALAHKLKVDRSNIYRDGIKELKKQGLIANHRRAGGYYRPDAPPPKYADQLGTKTVGDVTTPR